MKTFLLAVALFAALLLATTARGSRSVAAASPTANPDDMMELRVVGYPTFRAGSRAAIRVMVVHPAREQAIAGAAVDVRLGKKGGKDDLLWSGLTDARGTAQASFEVPDVDKGAYTLTVTARSTKRTETISTDVQIERAAAVYLSTDKPLYQPGQMIYVRTLSLSRPQLTPIAGRELELIIEDARGNKVFKRKLETDKFGVAAAQFSLASEVNMGSYRITAVVAGATAEKTVTVERYQLPKFKVSVTTDKPFYKPGETVKGKVQVDYLFGKPVAGGTVEVRGRVLEISWSEQAAKRPLASGMEAQALGPEGPFASLNGKTNSEGAYSFEATLPKFLVGQDLLKGKAPVEFLAVVEDKASHREEGRASVSAGNSPLTVDVIPDGAMARGIPGTIFVVVADGDGSPAAGAQVDVTVGAVKKSARTELASLAYLRAGTGASTVTKALKWLVQNKDANGNWHSTMATTLTLKALLKASPGQGAAAGGKLLVSLDGRQVGELKLDASNADLMQQLDLGGNDLRAGKHDVALTYSGEGALMYQIAGRTYRPWSEQPEPPRPLLSLDVDYDRTKLAQNESVKVKVKAGVNIGESAQMVMIDVGVPPGFDVDSSTLTALIEQKRIAKYGQTARQVMLYVVEIKKGQPFEVEFEMRARYPIRAVAPEAQAYLYYTPEQRTVVKPVAMDVTGK